jgi:hypothetical protein
VFHEARRLLDAGDFQELERRASSATARAYDRGLGELVDAVLLQALASKEAKIGNPVIDRVGYYSMSPLEDVLDCQVIEVLAGMRKREKLDNPGGTRYWQGARFGDRHGLKHGAGYATAAEIDARDHFIRGVLAYLADDKAQARVLLRKCTKADQRCSHEYHVAEWLLEKRLKK